MKELKVTYLQRINVYTGYNTETHYKYDPLMLRMTNLTTLNPNGNILDLNYGYDPVGNITKIDNVGLNPYHQEYNYDATYQLKTAEGSWYNNNQITYDLSMNYSPCGRILNKTLGGNKYDNSNIPISMDKDFAYDYNTTNPYSVDHIYDGVNGKDEYFNWDEKGNMIIHQSPQWNDDKRLFCWTEDNRLQAVKDYNTGSYYNYDAQGERNLKLTGVNINVTQNGQSVNTPVLDQQTLYASALVTVNDRGYTKHYFEENNRICSKIGNGELRDINILVDPLEGEYKEQRDKQAEGIMITYKQCMNIDPYIQNRNIYDDIIKPYEYQVNPDEPSFYYHGDHLGSASYITEDNGNETQHLVYLPFGEDWVDMKYNTQQFETPFKFNGKEKDPETGYHYYGARFYWSEGSIFLSTDPMSDDRPNLTSYNYCQNNPVMLIDPDGNSDVWVSDPSNPEKGTFYDKNVKSPQDAKDKGLEYKGETVLIADKNGNTKYGDENGTLHDAKLLPEVVISDKAENNTADKIFSAGMTGALIISQLDSPALGPADLIAVTVAVETLKPLIRNWVMGEIIQAFAHVRKKQSKGKSGSDRHDGQYTHGGKNNKPNPNQRKGADKRTNKGKIIN